MRILVLGNNGQVGTELALRRRQWNANWIFAGREECDLARPASIRDFVRGTTPDAIVNAAAYTAVDRAEAERDLCFAVNGEAPGVIAEEAARLGALLIHYSTDYVFDGQKSEPYSENDLIAPQSVYGASKAAGEQAIQAVSSRYWVLRTSWVYSGHGKNFLLTMLRLGREKPELRIVDDQVGAPTSASAIAEATLRLLGLTLSPERPSGIYHMTAAGSTSWCGFAREIFAQRGGRQPRVTAISSREYPTAAQRPANSVLANEKFEHAFGFRLASWQEQLTGVLSEIKDRQPE